MPLHQSNVVFHEIPDTGYKPILPTDSSSGIVWIQIGPQPCSKSQPLDERGCIKDPKTCHTRQKKKNTISAQQFYFEDEKSVTNGTALQCHLWELEVDLLAGELLVDGAEGLSLVLNVGLLGLVQMNLEQACSVQADPKFIQIRILIRGDYLIPDPLSNNLCWVDKIIQDSCVDGHQGAGPVSDVELLVFALNAPFY